MSDRIEAIRQHVYELSREIDRDGCEEPEPLPELTPKGREIYARALAVAKAYVAERSRE